jgi:hypothetical protein
LDEHVKDHHGMAEFEVTFADGEAYTPFYISWTKVISAPLLSQVIAKLCIARRA